MWLYIGIFAVEFFWSVVSNRSNQNVIKRKPWKAASYGVISATISWAIPLYVYLYSQDWTFALPAIIGDACGDWYSAKRKKNTKKKDPVNV